MRNTILSFVAASFLISCTQDESLTQLSEHYQNLSGTWLLAEQGYSPGSGYITEPVPAEPAQLVSFLPDMRIQSNISGLNQYQFYLLDKDSSSAETVLALYHTDPKENPGQQPGASYTVIFDDEMLKLHFRWCIEGCHMGFKPYKQGTEE